MRDKKRTKRARQETIRRKQIRAAKAALANAA